MLVWAGTPYILPPLVAALVSIPVAIEALRNREEPAAEAFLAVVVMVFTWSVFYAVELSQPTVEAQVFWRELTLIVGSTLPPLWVVFTFRYAGLDGWLSTPVLGVLTAELLGYAVLVVTNSRHGLLWDGVAAGLGPGPALSFTPLYYAHLLYLYALVVVGIAALAWVAADSATVYRKQALVLFFAGMLPFAANVASKLGLSPLPGVDLTTFGFGLAVAVIALAMFRFDLLDVAHVAQRHWMNQLNDGFVVIGLDGRVVESNSIAREALSPPPTNGEPITVPLSGDQPVTVAGDTIEATVDGTHRFY
ncbi:MAG: histidine kinase N-terminal 7TM domain-containing protein, partial [Halolamina sp.]